MKQCLLAMLVVGLTVTKGYGAQSTQPPVERPESFYTLANPGPITNMAYRCREISADGKTLIQTRFWLRGENARLLREEASNTLGSIFVSEVPDTIWGRMEMVSELIKTKQGTWARSWRLSEPSPAAKKEAALLRQKLENKYGKENVTEKAVSPGKWYPSSTDSLSLYRLNVNRDAYKNRSSDDAALKEGRVKFSIPNDKAADHFIEAEFDPETYLKLRQRVFHGKNVIQEETWNTHAVIDPTQFVISPARTHAEPITFVGIGLLFQSSKTGPFLISAVFPDSPAKKTGILKGELLISIDGRSTEHMSLSDATGLLKGEPGSTVTIEIRGSGTETNQCFILKREKIVSDGVIATAEDSAKSKH